MAKEGAALVINDLGGSRDGSGDGGKAMADLVVDEIKEAGGEAVANYDNVATVDGARRILLGQPFVPTTNLDLWARLGSHRR